MHRGYEKLTEFRTYPQITTLINRIDWLSRFANEVPFIAGAEKLMGIEAPPRAQYIRTMLFELSRIATFLLFLGDMGLQVGALTPAFYGFRDREYVLNLIEGVTGGRFHPNFNRIGGLKDDLPWGWIAETSADMRKVLDVCDEFEDLVLGNQIFEQRTRSIGIIPAELGAAYGVSGSNLPGVRRRLGPAPRRQAPPRVQRARLEGVDPPRRRLVRPLLGAAAGGARVGPHGAAAARRDAERADHGQGAAHHQGARRARSWVNTENPLGEMGYYVVSKGATGPFRVKIRSASFSNVSILPWLLRGVFVPDIITILASLYFILGDIDR